MSFLLNSIHTEDYTRVVILVVFLVLGGCLVIAYWYRPEEFHKTRISVFFTTLASVAIVLVGFNIVLTSYSFEFNQEFSRTTKTKEAIDKLWLFPNQLLANSSSARPEFLADFYMNNPELHKAVQATPTVTNPSVKTILEEQYIAIVMLQAWEDFLTMRKYDETGAAVWLNNFLQWAQNPHLKVYYQQLKNNYKTSTNQLAEILFEYATKLPVPTNQPGLYEKNVQAILQDPRFLAIQQ